MFKFPSKDYAKNRFDILRQSVYFSANFTENLTVLTGIISQIPLRSYQQSLFDLYYGPTLVLKWSFKPKLRETFEWSITGWIKLVASLDNYIKDFSIKG